MSKKKIVGTRYKIKDLRIVAVEARDKIGNWQADIKKGERIISTFDPDSSFETFIFVGKLIEEEERKI